MSKSSRTFFWTLIIFLTTACMALASGKIVVVGDIHEFLDKSATGKIVDAAGHGGLLIMPGDFLTRPYPDEYKFNPRGISSAMSLKDLLRRDAEVAGWFRGAQKLAGIAVIMGNHEYSRGEERAKDILKMLPNAVILDRGHRTHDFAVDGQRIRVIGYPSAVQYRYNNRGRDKYTESKDPTLLPIAHISSIERCIKSNSRLDGIIIMTHQNDNEDIDLAKALARFNKHDNIVITGGHSHNIMTFKLDSSMTGYHQRIVDYTKNHSHSTVIDRKDLFSIPILKTGWHNEAHYSLQFVKEKNRNVIKLHKLKN